MNDWSPLEGPQKGTGSDLPARMSGRRVSDYQGRTNWDTWNTGVMIDNERETNEQAREIVEAGMAQGLDDNALAAKLRDWAIPTIIGPHNQQAIDSAKEWNSIPEEERLDYDYEAFKDKHGDDPNAMDLIHGLAGGPDVSDTEPTLIDPELVNWHELVQSIKDEFEEDAEFERRKQQAQDSGIDWASNGGDNYDKMRDAIYRHHGALPDSELEKSGISRFQHPNAYFNTNVTLTPQEFLQTNPNWDNYIEPKSRIPIWSINRKRHPNQPNPDKDIDWNDPEIRQHLEADPNYQHIMQNGHTQRLHDYADDLMYAITHGTQHPHIPVMQQALAQRGYTPEQISEIMKQRWRFNPNTNEWEDMERNMDVAPAPDKTLDQPGDLTIPNEWLSKTAAPEDWSPIEIEELEEPYEFGMPHSVEQRFVQANECPQCQGRLLKSPGGIYCSHCGWEPRAKVAFDWSNLMGGVNAKRRPWWVDMSNPNDPNPTMWIGESGSTHPYSLPLTPDARRSTILGALDESTSPPTFFHYVSQNHPNLPLADKALSHVQRAYFQMKDDPSKRTAEFDPTRGSIVYHKGNDRMVDAPFDKRSIYLYDPDRDILHWGNPGQWHGDIRRDVENWYGQNGLQPPRYADLIAGAVGETDRGDKLHGVYSPDPMGFEGTSGDENYDHIYDRLHELTGVPVSPYMTPDSMLDMLVPPDAGMGYGSSDWKISSDGADYLTQSGDDWWGPQSVNLQHIDVPGEAPSMGDPAQLPANTLLKNPCYCDVGSTTPHEWTGSCENGKRPIMEHEANSDADSNFDWNTSLGRPPQYDGRRGRYPWIITNDGRVLIGPEGGSHQMIEWHHGVDTDGAPALGEINHGFYPGDPERWVKPFFTNNPWTPEQEQQVWDTFDRGERMSGTHLDWRHLRPKLGKGSEDTEAEGDQVGFLREPHKELYPPLFEGMKMRPDVIKKLKDYIFKALTEFGDPDNFIYFTAYGSGLSYNWDEGGDLDLQLWIDISKYDGELTQDDLIAAVRRSIGPINFPTFKDLDVPGHGTDAAMMIQYYAKPGTGSKEENLASKPYACYDLEEGKWLVRPTPMEPSFYGEGFLRLLPEATDFAEQAEGVLDELERHLLDYEFWIDLDKEDPSDEFDLHIKEVKEQMTAEHDTVKRMFDEVFQGRAKAYSPEGEGIHDERDIMQKLLEVWGIFQRLKTQARMPLPWIREASMVPDGWVKVDPHPNPHPDSEEDGWGDGGQWDTDTFLDHNIINQHLKTQQQAQEYLDYLDRQNRKPEWPDIGVREASDNWDEMFAQPDYGFRKSPGGEAYRKFLFHPDLENQLHDWEPEEGDQAYSDFLPAHSDMAVDQGLDWHYTPGIVTVRPDHVSIGIHRLDPGHSVDEVKNAVTNYYRRIYPDRSIVWHGVRNSPNARAERLAADNVPGNSMQDSGHWFDLIPHCNSAWVWLDGHVGFGTDHGNIAKDLANTRGYDPTKVNYISNMISRNLMPEGHAIAVGTLKQGYPFIWASTRDRNAVFDDVMRARDEQSMIKAAGLKDDAHRAYDGLIANGGFSLTRSLKAAQGQAYFVSYEQPNQTIPLPEFSPESIMSFRQQVLPMLKADTETLLGGWLDSGMVYLDVSRAFQDRAAAIAFGHANNQLAIWDGFNNVEIRLSNGYQEVREARIRKLGHAVEFMTPIYSPTLADENTKTSNASDDEVDNSWAQIYDNIFDIRRGALPPSTPPPAIIQPATMQQAQAPGGVSLPNLTPQVRQDEARYTYGGIGLQPASSMSATITYQEQPQITPGTRHVAAWLGVMNGKAWLQTGIAFAGTSAQLYMEAMLENGKYVFRPLGTAQPNVSYSFSLTQARNGMWTVKANGNLVGTVRVPGGTVGQMTAEISLGTNQASNAAGYSISFSHVRIKGYQAMPTPLAEGGAKVKTTGADSFVVYNAVQASQPPTATPQPTTPPPSSAPAPAPASPAPASTPTQSPMGQTFSNWGWGKKINPVVPSGEVDENGWSIPQFMCTRCGEGPYGSLGLLKQHIEQVHNEKL